MEHPLPQITGHYEMSQANGAQWVLDETGPRMLTHEDMAAVTNVDSTTLAWLLNKPKVDVQRYFAVSSPVSLTLRLLESLLPRLQSISAEANSPRGTVKEVAVVSAFAAKCGELAKEEVQQFEQVYHYVSAMVAHAFPTLEQFRVEQAKEKELQNIRMMR